MTSYTTSKETESFQQTGNSKVDPLLNDTFVKWSGNLSSGTNLSFSFPWLNGQPVFWQSRYSNEPSAPYHVAFNPTQMEATKNALQSWANVANLNFTEVTETGSEVGDLRFAFSSAVDAISGTWGWAYYPNNYWASAGDVWVKTSLADSLDWSIGDYNYQALIHEIGHALGLKHPGDYDANSGLSAGPFLSSDLDNRRYTIMSYNNPNENVYPSRTMSSGQAQWLSYYINPETPMVLDVAAIQYLYGTNTTYKTGDDEYAFDLTRPFFKTLWDAGGNDTINASNFSVGCKIDLTPGSYSSLRYPAPSNTAGVTPTYDGTENLGIAYGCTIENAIGGAGSDELFGNDAANLLSGGLSSDTLYGGGGNDTLISGSGTDTVIYLGQRSQYTLTKISEGYLISDQTGADGTDFLSQVEQIEFLDQIITLSVLVNGTENKDHLTGGLSDDQMYGMAGNDLLTSLSGDDSLDGGIGNDTLVGGIGNDTFYVDSTKDVVTEKNNEGIDTVISSLTHTLKMSIENLTLFGASAINGMGNALNNQIIGNDAANEINGGLGNDTLTGGIGADSFVINTKLGPANVDTITDFRMGDKIVLASTIFTKLKGDKDLSDNLASDVATSLLHYLVYDASIGLLYYDADGSKTKLSPIMVAIIGSDQHPDLSAADFIIT